MKRRFGAEIELHPPRVPYLETIRKPAKAHGRYKKQTGGRGQFGDCHIEIEPAEAGTGFEFVNAIKGGVIPGGFIPAVEKGDRARRWSSGVVAGYPVKDVQRAPLRRPAPHASTPRRWPSRSPARWPSSRRWPRPSRTCSSRSCR